MNVTARVGADSATALLGSIVFDRPGSRTTIGFLAVRELL